MLTMNHMNSDTRLYSPRLEEVAGAVSGSM